MEKNTKILLGLAVAGVVAYLVLKPKKATAQTISNGSPTKTDSNSIIDAITGGLAKKIESIDAKKVTNTTSTTTRTTTRPASEITQKYGTTDSPYLKEGVAYIQNSDGSIAYGDETSGRFNSVDPSHGNPFSIVNSDPLFWEDTGVDWFWVPDDAFAGQGYGGRFSEDRQV
jgi:hypothetical protein